MLLLVFLEILMHFLNACNMEYIKVTYLPVCTPVQLYLCLHSTFRHLFVILLINEALFLLGWEKYNICCNSWTDT